MNVAVCHGGNGCKRIEWRWQTNFSLVYFSLLLFLNNYTLLLPAHDDVRTLLVRELIRRFNQDNCYSECNAICSLIKSFQCVFNQVQLILIDVRCQLICHVVRVTPG